MTNEQFIEICKEAVDILKAYGPYKSGNLVNNAIKYSINGNEFKIYVDQSVAPYMPYTNEPWISPKWHGKKNPNENWFGLTARYILEWYTQRVGGDNMPFVSDDLKLEPYKIINNIQRYEVKER